jgi:hypothetical protein
MACEHSIDIGRCQAVQRRDYFRKPTQQASDIPFVAVDCGMREAEAL